MKRMVEWLPQPNISADAQEEFVASLEKIFQRIRRLYDPVFSAQVVFKRKNAFDFKHVGYRNRVQMRSGTSNELAKAILYSRDPSDADKRYHALLGWYFDTKNFMAGNRPQ
jgi:hypothetical protein